MILPSVAAEPADGEDIMEIVHPSETDTVSQETNVEEGKETEAVSEEFFSENGSVPDALEEEREAEIPANRETSLEIDSNGNSIWLSDYSYLIEEGRLILTAYHGEETEVTVPGSACVSNTQYNKVYLTARMWGKFLNNLIF
jgi:hypothetical protein